MFRMLKNPRVLLIAVGVLALVAVAAWPRAVAVDVAAVWRAPLAVTVDEEGETRVRDRFVISAPVGGEVLRIDLEPGDPIARGQVVARIRPGRPGLLDERARVAASAGVGAAQATLNRARAEQGRAAAALTRARQQLERTRELAGGGLAPRDELDAREADVRTAEEGARAATFAVTQAEYDVQVARARLIQSSGQGQDIEITAPIAGTLLKRYHESQVVVPAGERLLEIGDPDELEIIADLLSSDAVKVRPGQPVRIEQWGGGQTLAGRVQRVEPSGFLKISALGVEEQRVNVIIDFETPEDGRRALGDAYRVEVRIVIWEAAGVLQVPTGALFRRGDQWALFVIDGGRARLRPVTLGQRTGANAQVSDGVQEGERVVLYPPDTLADDDRVTERATQPTPSAGSPDSRPGAEGPATAT